jgi:ribosomal protein S18 acetylase RimI-like enzyme
VTRRRSDGVTQQEPAIRRATPADLPALLPLMRGYYRDDGLEFAPANERAMARLLANTQFGRVLLLELGREVIGYLALCTGFSLELGGKDAFVDELFIDIAHRRRGHGARLVRHAASEARSLGVAALHLEVDRENAAAQALYESMGYEKRDRYYVMTLMVKK